MTDKPKADEQKKTGISYIFNFYQNIVSLTSMNAQYTNLMLEMKYKYGDSSEGTKKMSEEEKNIVTYAVQKCRELVMTVYIQYNSIRQVLSEKTTDNKALIEAYNNIKKSFIIPTDEVEKFVIEINSILVNSIIQKLLESNEELISEIFKNETTTPAT